MRRSQKSLSILALGIALGGTALAQGQVLPQEGDTFSVYAEADGWTVYVNETRGTCLAERVGEDSVLQMGVTGDATLGYMGVFTQNPTDIVTTMVERVEIEIGGESYVGEATEMANLREGYSGGYIVANNPAFIQAVADESSMIARVDDRDPLEISLEGTAAAMETARECVAAQGG